MQVLLEVFFERNFLTTIFWSKIFYCFKIISSKTGLQGKIFSKKIFVEKFLWLQNYFLENGFQEKKIEKNFSKKIFIISKSYLQITGLQ